MSVSGEVPGVFVRPEASEASGVSGVSGVSESPGTRVPSDSDGSGGSNGSAGPVRPEGHDDGLERINPAHLAPPTGFSHGVRAASGTMVFLAGQTALDGEGRIVGDGIVAQFERALGNLLDVAAASGAGPSDLAKLTVFAVDVADYRRHAREIGLVWKRLVGTDFPAMAVIGATRLWDEAALVEIEGIAVVREGAVGA